MSNLMEKQLQLCENAYVDVYSSAYLVMMDYPYRFETPKDNSPTVAEKAESYVLDSNITDDDIGTSDIYDAIEKRDPDYVVPADVVDDPVQTTVAIEELLDVLWSTDVNVGLLIPLQRGGGVSYTQHYDAVCDSLESYGYDPSVMRFAVGGMQNLSVAEQIQRTASVRDHIGDDVYLHSFGVGMSTDWIYTINEYPDLVDSIDMSTPIHAAKSGNVYDTTMTTTKLETAQGSKSTIMSAWLAEYSLMVMNYLLSPHSDKQFEPSDSLKEVLPE